MHKGMPGHKARCRCVACKAMRKRGKGKGKSSHKAPKHTLTKLRRELTQATRGAAKASTAGDAASWVKFRVAVTHLERSIAAAKAR